MKKKFIIPMIIIIFTTILVIGYTNFTDIIGDSTSATAKSKNASAKEVKGTSSSLTNKETTSTNKNLSSKETNSTSKALTNNQPVTSKNTLSLTKKEMLEDYDNMWKNIEENYPYMGVAIRTTGNDYVKVKNTYRDKIASITSDKAFGSLINSCLSEFAVCGHMSMLNSDSYYLDFYKLYKQISNDAPHLKFLYKTLNNKVSKKYYNFIEPDIKGESTTTTDDSNSESASSNLVNFTTKKYPDIKTVYIKIPELIDPSTNVPKLIEFFKSISNYDNCIIDIRGNGGGDSSYWTQGIALPNAKKDLAYSTYELIKGEASKTYEQKDGFKLYPIKNLDASAFTNLNKEDLADMDYFIKETCYINKAKKPCFKGKFYVLTDQVVYSSAEGFASFCKQSGFATLIGETTGGDGLGIDPLISVLPNSGICYRFSSSYGLNPDGSSNEEYGTTPDIKCDSKDALKVCLNLIKKGK